MILRTGEQKFTNENVLFLSLIFMHPWVVFYSYYIYIALETELCQNIKVFIYLFHTKHIISNVYPKFYF